MAIADLGSDCYPSEPILVPSKDNPEQGWILTVVFDGDTNSWGLFSRIELQGLSKYFFNIEIKNLS